MKSILISSTMFVCILLTTSMAYPEMKAIFTFNTDDGHKEFNRELSKVFLEYGYRYTLTINSASSMMAGSGKDVLSMAEIKIFDQQGFEIGGHARAHRYAMTPIKAFTIQDLRDNRYSRALLSSIANTQRGIVVRVNLRKKTFPHSTLKEFLKRLNVWLNNELNSKLEAKPYDSVSQYLPTTSLKNSVVLLSREATFEFDRGLDQGQLDNEICGDKALTESFLGHPMVTFAYPFGSYTEAAAETAKKCGYKSARVSYVKQTEPEVRVKSGLRWTALYGGKDYLILHGASDQRDFRSLNKVDADLYKIPLNREINQLFKSIVASTSESGTVDEKRIKAQLQAFVSEAKSKHQWVIILDHKGTYPIWLYRLMLDVLKADPKVGVLTIRDVIEGIYGK